MRTKAALGLAASLVLMTGSSWAAETKGESTGKGAPAPAAAPQGDTASDTATEVVPPSAGGPTKSTNPDVATRRVEVTKPWEVGSTFEMHRMIRQDDLNGAGSSKVFNVLSLYARYDLTEHDRLTLGDFIEQRFIADEGETGIRSGDVTLRYTRSVPLPRQFSFAASAALSAPTSYYSQKTSLITAPTVALQLDKKFGKYVSVSARASGAVFLYKYSSAAGGLPNGKYSLGGTLEAEVAMPFHEQLSVGVDVFDGYRWLYDVQSAGGTSNGVVQDSQYPSQPMTQSYGGEIFARYLLPNLAGLKSDISVALADGDPSFAYNSVLHDGVTEFYLFYRQTASVYGTFSIRY